MPEWSPRPWLLILLYALAGGMPLLIAGIGAGSERGVSGELALGAGLVALAMLLVQFISSGRYERISGRAGIDLTLRFHQLTACGLLALALLHPVLFMLPPDLAGAIGLPRQLWSLAGAGHLRSGVVALLALLALVPLGMLRTRLPVRYEAWRASHVLLALVAAGGSLHHALSVGGYSQETVLKAYWLGLASLALGALAWAYLVRPFRLMRGAFRVAANSSPGPGMRELVLEPAGRAGFAYRAGQFVWVSFGRRAFPLGDHPYSLASSPLEGDRLRLMIKARGDFSAAAGDIAVGTPAYVDGPHGNFTLAGHQWRTLALFAGGIGIAPVLGLVRELQLSGEHRPVRLVYGARNEERLVGRDVIDAARGAIGLEVRYILEQPAAGWQGGTGGISPVAVEAAIGDWDPQHCLCMMCGPTAMMLSAERALLEAGVPAHNIVYERFEYD